MSVITIKKIDEKGIHGDLDIGYSSNIPVLFSGSAVGLLENNKDRNNGYFYAGKASISPDIVNIYKNDKFLYPMIDIKLSELLGKR